MIEDDRNLFKQKSGWGLVLMIHGAPNLSSHARTILRKLTPVFQRKGLVLEVELVDSVSRMHRLVSMVKTNHISLCFRNYGSKVVEIRLFMLLLHNFKSILYFWICELRSGTGPKWCQALQPSGTAIDPGRVMLKPISECPSHSRSFQEKAGPSFNHIIPIMISQFYQHWLSCSLRLIHPTYPGQLCRTMASASPRKRMYLAVWGGRVIEGTSSLWWKGTCRTPVWSKIPYWFGHNHWCQLQRTFGIEWM